MKTALITGTTGALGGVVADVFEASGWRVIRHHRNDQVPVDAIHALINIAGGFDMGPAVHETDEAFFDRLMDINAKTVIRMTSAVVPGMITRQNGSIINVAAASAIRAPANMGAYAASKSAVIRLTEAMSAELREQGIRANCILPGIIDTPANRKAMPKADFNKWVIPSAIADVMLFLASDASHAITGQAISV